MLPVRAPGVLRKMRTVLGLPLPVPPMAAGRNSRGTVVKSAIGVQIRSRILFMGAKVGKLFEGMEQFFSIVNTFLSSEEVILVVSDDFVG